MTSADPLYSCHIILTKTSRVNFSTPAIPFGAATDAWSSFETWILGSSIAYTQSACSILLSPSILTLISIHSCYICISIGYFSLQVRLSGTAIIEMLFSMTVKSLSFTCSAIKALFHHYVCFVISSLIDSCSLSAHLGGYTFVHSFIYFSIARNLFLLKFLSYRELIL